jgi:hypothetical protein
VKIDALGPVLSTALVGHMSDTSSWKRTIGLRRRKLRETDGPTAQKNAAAATTKTGMRSLCFTLSTSGTMSLAGP